MSNPFVSVIISAYKSEKYISQAIESVLNQTYTRWDLIIIDDGNGELDNTYKIAKKYKNDNDNKNIRIYKTNNLCLSRCRNLGAFYSQGDYLLFLDADDYIDKTFLDKTVQLAEHYPQYGFVYTDTQHIDEENNFCGFWNHPEYNMHDLLLQNHISSCSLIVKEMFDEMNGFDENNRNYYEDWEFWIHAGSKGWYGKHLPEKLFYYRVHKDSGMQSERTNKLSNVYFSYIINKFSELYDREWIKQAKDILNKYPNNFMEFTPQEQDQWLKDNDL
jgi:glycosyltransferase involved in cell wall biosynthesis